MSSLGVLNKYDGILAQFYDYDHQWRNYERQIELVSTLFPNTASKKLKVLELACGSGSHSIPLAQAGFNVLGVDRSNELLRQANEKIKNKDWDVQFLRKDIFKLKEETSLHFQFDGVLLLGSTLSIQDIYFRFNEILECASLVLKEGGFFIFDVVIGLNFKAISPQPLQYKTPKTAGTLNIKGKKNLNEKTVTYTYQWKVEGIHVSAQEVLSILQPKEIYLKIEPFRDQFEIFKTLSDFSLKEPYKKGDKNLVVVLKKKCTQ